MEEHKATDNELRARWVEHFSKWKKSYASRVTLKAMVSIIKGRAIIEDLPMGTDANKINKLLGQLGISAEEFWEFDSENQ